MLTFKRIYIRRYSDNGQVTAYAEHDKGRTDYAGLDSLDHRGDAPLLLGCSNDACEVAPSVTGETKAEAIAIWNNRA